MVASIRRELLNVEQQDIALCLRSVRHRNFMPGQSVHLSLPNSGCHGIQTSRKYDCLHFVNFLLETVHQDALWPLHVSRADSLPVEIRDQQLRMHHNYIIFMWPEEMGGDILETLVTQLDDLQLTLSWNPRAKFLVVVTENDTGSTQSLAVKICEIMWNMNRIINVVILIPRADVLLVEGEIHILDLYTWFPYERSDCAKPSEVFLVGQCLPDNNGKFSSNASLFPDKIPNNLHGCPIRVSASQLIPYVISTSNYTDSDGNVVYTYRGLEIEYLLLVAEAANLTMLFLPPAEGDVKDSHLQQLLQVFSGTSDVAIGHFPLNFLLLPYADPTITVVFDTLRWYIPCPRPVSRMEMVMGVYTSPVWCSIALVFFLTALVFWRSANVPHGSLVTESHVYREILSCACVVWSVSLGVAVPEMPRSSKLRALFSLFLCYCFVMDVVFHAYFISYLVKPGYHHDISNLDELVESGLTYGKEENLEFFLRLAKYHEQERFKSFVDCSDRFRCLERVFLQGDITMLSPVTDVMYALSHIGMTQSRKILCTLDDGVFRLDVSMYLTKGHPLLDLFNKVIRRCIEAGLVAKYWSDVIFYVHLQHMGTSKEPGCEVCSDMYFVFSLSHLRVAFAVLVFGLTLSVIVFLAELLCKCHSKSRKIATSGL